MSIRRLTLPVLGAALLLLAGCAVKPQLPVELASAAITTGTGAKVGVAMTKPPKPSVEFPGAGCLLCIITAQAANTTVSKHAESLPVDDLVAVREQLAAAMRKKGMNVVVIPEPLQLETLPEMKSDEPNTAKRDFRPLKAKYGIDRLVLVNVEAVGLMRNYSAYIPTSDPRMFLRGNGSMVNLADNRYEWYMPVNLYKAADGPWDEPPKFPGLTNAFYETLEKGKDQILAPWAR